MKKADAFKKHLEGYKDMGIVKVIIEEPLLNSNNAGFANTRSICSSGTAMADFPK